MHLAGAQLLPFAQSHFTSLSGKHVLALDRPPDFNACLRLNLHLCGAVWVHMLITRAFLTDSPPVPTTHLRTASPKMSSFGVLRYCPAMRQCHVQVCGYADKQSGSRKPTD